MTLEEDEEKVSVLMEEFKKDFSLLIEAGFIALKQFDEIGSRRLFSGAQVLNRYHTAPQIGIGYIALNKLEVKEALKWFEGVLQREENPLAETFAGICYLLSKNKKKKGETMIRDAMAKTDDPTIKNLGKVSLEWAEKDLPKSEKAKNLIELPDD